MVKIITFRLNVDKWYDNFSTARDNILSPQNDTIECHPRSNRLGPHIFPNGGNSVIKDVIIAMVFW